MVRISRRMLLKAMAAVGTLGCGNWLAACGGEKGPVVEMKDLQYAPARLTIKAGDTVTWRNTDGIAHTVTADPAKARDKESTRLPEGAEPWDSGNIAAGQSWSRTFDVAGEYTYFCIPHELAGMVASLTVEA
ncbi:MAG: plastocyanin/azurin family copper-binding protein [Chloroflexota bacterium]|nr:plastocyanin/azurin family copper-binding protein [Chloroflexota bacterium]